MTLEYWMRPMLCNSGSEDMAFDESEWATEGKWDGFRAVVYRTAEGKVRLWLGRNSANYDGHLPYLDELFAEVLAPDTCIDGELMSTRGRSAVQSAMFTQGIHIPSPALPAVQFFVFDVLRDSGQDVRKLSWEDRRRRLERIDVGDGSLLKHSLLLPTEGALEIARDAGLEGVVHKRRHSIYTNTRSSNWIKVKWELTDEARVIGFKPGKRGGRWDGKVGAFEVEMLDSGARTTVKCGTDATHIDASEHPERWLGAILEIGHRGIQPSGVPLNPQNKGRRLDREPQTSAAGARIGTAPTVGAPPAAEPTRKRRPPVANGSSGWMRNYGQMTKPGKLEGCIRELQAYVDHGDESGDAVQRVLANGGSVEENLAAAQAVLEGKQAAA